MRIGGNAAGASVKKVAFTKAIGAQQSAISQKLVAEGW
jgi:hypothetical protein